MNYAITDGKTRLACTILRISQHHTYKSHQNKNEFHRQLHYINILNYCFKKIAKKNHPLMLVLHFPISTDLCTKKNLSFCNRRKIETMQEVKEAKRGGGATMQRSESVRLKEKKVKDMMVGKKRLVEVPYTASLAQTMNTLVANKIVAVPVAAPPGQWIGAGGSMIVESDKQTGAVRKHYIGMVTMLDIVAHIAGEDHLSGGDNITQDLDQRMSDSVSSIIGHSFEGLSLWTLNPNTRFINFPT